VARYVLIGGAVVAVGLLFFFFKGSSKTAPPARPSEPKQEEAAAPTPVWTGWNADLVVLARRLHHLAHEQDASSLRLLVDAEAAYRQRSASGDGAIDGTAAEEVDEGIELEAAPPAPPWSALTRDDQTLFTGELVEEMTADELLHDWDPYACAGENEEGVVERNSTQAVVRLVLRNRMDAGAPDRHVEWRFVPRGATWKAFHWERWYSPEELKTLAKKDAKKIETVELSDGSRVIEGEVRPLPHMDETTPAERKHIEELVANVLTRLAPGHASHEVSLLVGE
jgi:hypothetical protein